MAFTDSTFVTVSSGTFPQLHIYSTADAIGTVVGSGYFSSITEKLKKGDIIHASTSTGGTIAVDTLTVASATGAATVTTTNGT